nr:zinc-binding dehydrogenase [Allorhizobium sonneratiae]
MLTAATSTCAGLLARWGQAAHRIYGVCRTRSQFQHVADHGMVPILNEDRQAVLGAARKADLVFDAVGGDLAGAILSVMRAQAQMVSYGLLSSQPIVATDMTRLRRFHIRDHFATLTPDIWQGWFQEIWAKLTEDHLPPVRRFALADWKAALDFFNQPQRLEKPILMMG